MMRVAMIEPVGGHGGMNYYDLALARSVEAHGIETTLFTSTLDDREREAVSDLRLYYEGVFGPDHALLRGLRFLRATLRSVALARSQRARLAHIHLFETGLKEWLLVKALRRAGLRIVATAHDVVSLADDSSRVGRFAREIYRSLDVVIAHNEAIESAIVGEMEVSPSRVRRIPHPTYEGSPRTDASREAARRRFGIESDRPVILFFGQIKRAKGLDVLLEAMPSVLAQHPDAILLIAGKLWKDDWCDYQDRIDALGIGHAIDARLGYVPDEDAVRLFHASDVAVYPYRRIYQSGGVLMAISHETPVVVSDLPAFRSTIDHGKTGLVFENGSPEQLGDRLIRTLRSPRQAAKMACAARAQVESEQGWGVIGERTSSVYRSLAAEQR